MCHRTGSLLLGLEFRRAELPKQETPRISEAFLILPFRAADVPCFEIHEQQDRFAAACGRLKTGYHLGGLPRFQPWIVHASREQGCRIRTPVFYEIVGAHGIEGFNPLVRLNLY